VVVRRGGASGIIGAHGHGGARAGAPAPAPGVRGDRDARGRHPRRRRARRRLVVVLNHRAVAGVHMLLPDTNSGRICYSSLRFPPTASPRKGLEKTTDGHGGRQEGLTVSMCGHDEPRIALSASRFLPRATRMDATAMVDGWYSTELVAARMGADKRSAAAAIGLHGTEGNA